MLTYQNDISPDRLPSYLAENGEIICGKTVIIADAVINSGKTMHSISMDLGKFSEKLIIATNVIQSESVEKFTGTPLYASRVSENKFIGYRMKKQNCNRGPDTGDRLFKLM
jgi:orotate phosphoribosyltransferase-like protein